MYIIIDIIYYIDCELYKIRGNFSTCLPTPAVTPDLPFRQRPFFSVPCTAPPSPIPSLLGKSGSSFCRFVSLVFIFWLYHAIFIPQVSSFLPLLLLLHLLRSSSPVLKDYLLAHSGFIIRNLNPRNTQSRMEQRSKRFFDPSRDLMRYR